MDGGIPDPSTLDDGDDDVVSDFVALPTVWGSIH